MRQCLVIALFSFSLGVSQAQTNSLKRNVLTRIDTNTPAQEAVMVQVEVAPGASTGRHTHHGIEIGYIQEGEFEMQVDGETMRKLKAGDSFAIPSGKIHDARNSGNTPARVIVTYVVEKDKALAVPSN